jgi:hypothetical protein
MTRVESRQTGKRKAKVESKEGEKRKDERRKATEGKGESRE